MEPQKIRCFISLHHFSSNNPFYWLELITEILNSLQIISVRENPNENQQKTIFLTYSESLKAHYRSFMRLLTLHCFFKTLNFFYMLSTIYLYLSLLYSHFVSLFSTFFSLLFSLRDTTRNILQFTMFVSISLKLPVTLRR